MTTSTPSNSTTELTAADYPGISAMCLTYGRVRILEEAIQSFLLQDYPGPKELIVLNDLPEQALYFEHPEVRIYNMSQRFESVGKKRDVCTRLAGYDWLMPWDDDDICLPHRMHYTMQYIREKNLSYFNPSRHLYFDQPSRKITWADWRHPSSNCFSRALYDQVGGYKNMSSGQDRVFEFAVRDHGCTTTFNIPIEGLSYVYRYPDIPYHLSAYHGHETKEVLTEIQRAISHGRDIPDEVKQQMRVNPEAEVRKNVLRRIENGHEPSGVIHLNPHWGHDYAGMFKKTIQTYNESNQ